MTEHLDTALHADKRTTPATRADFARSVRAAVEHWSRTWRPWRHAPAVWVFIDDDGLRVVPNRGRIINNPYADGIHPVSYQMEAVRERLGDHRCVTLAEPNNRGRANRNVRLTGIHRDQTSFQAGLNFEPAGWSGARFAPSVDVVLDRIEREAA